MYSNHQSPTQFAHRCIGFKEYAPPEPHKSGFCYATTTACWLCGGPTGDTGWPLWAILKSTFTNHNRAKVPSSDTVCQSCIFFVSKETWEAYLVVNPNSGLKTGRAMSWRFYSHLFALNYHECPTRPRLRDLLLDPPAPPFMLIISLTGQKHLIFRAAIAHNRNLFPVQLEEEQVVVDRLILTDVFILVEGLLATAFTRTEILTGRYSQARIRKAGLTIWKKLEYNVALHRRYHPLLLKIATHCALAPQNKGKP